MRKLHRQCPVCAGQYGTVMKNIKMLLPDSIPIPGEYNVVCCSGCGFAFADVNASQTNYNEYYQKYNDYSQIAKIKAGNTSSMNDVRVRLLSTYTDRRAKILDVGCGSGELLKMLKKNGYSHLYGIDPSSDSISSLRNYGIEGRVKNIFDEVEVEHRHMFDVVVSTAVIEHVFDLNLFIQQLQKYLISDKGILYIDAPAVEGFSEFYTSRANYFNQEHINYFSLTSLDRLFFKYGYERINTDSESFAVIDEEQPEKVITAMYHMSSRVQEYKKDTISQRSIQNYFEQDHIEEQAVYKSIQKFISEKDTQIVIWGTGAYTMQLLHDVPELLEKTAYFIDNNSMKTGREIMGKRIFLPEKLCEDSMVYPILICSMKNAGDIVNQIKLMQISNRCLSISNRNIP